MQLKLKPKPSWTFVFLAEGHSFYFFTPDLSKCECCITWASLLNENIHTNQTHLTCLLGKVRKQNCQIKRLVCITAAVWASREQHIQDRWCRCVIICPLDPTVVHLQVSAATNQTSNAPEKLFYWCNMLLVSQQG